MGQYWRFVNIDKQKKTGHLGKMAEFFFSDEPTQLIYLLAIPPIPLKNASSNRQELPGGWAGDRIICIGNGAHSWPDGVVTAADFQGSTSDASWTSDDETSDEDSDTDAALQDPTKRPSASFIRLCHSARSTDFDQETRAAYPEDQVWVLRSISKKLYIRSDRIPVRNRGNRLAYGVGHRGLESYPGLGNALLANIGWSDDSSTSMRCGYRCDPTRGSWAGDRIDVRLLDHVMEDMTQEGWKDISRQEAAKLHRIWCEDAGGSGKLPKEPKPSL